MLKCESGTGMVKHNQLIAVRHDPNCQAFERMDVRSKA
jgi:hypothetical protein